MLMRSYNKKELCRLSRRQHLHLAILEILNSLHQDLGYVDGSNSKSITKNIHNFLKK